MGNKNSTPETQPNSDTIPYEDKLKRNNEQIRLLREKKFQESQQQTENPSESIINKPIEKNQTPILQENRPTKLEKTSNLIEKPQIVEEPHKIATITSKSIPEIKIEVLESKYLEESLDIIEKSVISSKSLKIDDIDEIFDTILRSPIPEYFEQNEEKLNYLYKCWIKSQNSYLLDNPKISTLKPIFQKKVYTYMVSLILTPSVYEIEENEEDFQDSFNLQSKLKGKFYEICLQDFNEEFIDGFFQNLLDESNEEDSFEFFESLLKRIFASFLKGSLEKTKPLITNISLLGLLFKKRKFIDMFCQKSLLFSANNQIKLGNELEKKTIFGAFLSSLSLLPSIENKVFEIYFKGVEKQSRNLVEKNIMNIREKINEPIFLLFKLLETLIKAGQKRSVLDWFALILEKNKEKIKMYNMNNLMNSSDGFLINLNRVLLLFCLPFSENDLRMLGKIDKIDINYVQYENNKLFQGFQPFNLEILNQNIKEYSYSEPNFITEIYFLSSYLMHINQKLYKNLLEFLIKLSKLHKNNPNAPEFPTLLSQKFAYESFLLDPLLIDNYLRLFSFTSLLCFSFLEGKYDSEQETFIIKGSIDELKCPENLARLPIYLAEDIYEYLLVFIQANPDCLIKKMKYFGLCCDFMLMVMSSKNLMANPHLRAKYVSFLSILVPEDGRQSSLNQFQQILLERKLFNELLIEGLIETFIDVEKTGSNNQFYEKFSYRHGVCKIFSFVLNNSSQKKFDYRGKFVDFLAKKKDKFLHFMFLLLNDLIYLLDEALSKLKDIKAYEETEGNIINLQEKFEKNKAYEENKRLVSTFLLFLNSYYENLDMFSYLGSDTLILEEIREKLVNNLNYTVEALNGQNALALKTKNMKKLNFDPKLILKCIIRLYLNLKNFESFLTTIIKDERSFNEKTFEKTLKILTRENLLEPDEIEAFRTMLDKLIEMRLEQKRTDEALGEIPEEFQDPLLNEIMIDPVLLPTSNVIVDRMTIVKHLLSDSTDPFNRKLLTKEMLVPQEELRRKIEEFRKEKLKINKEVNGN